MVASENTRKMLRELRGANWTEIRGDARHTVYACPRGTHTIPVPASHNLISPGVVRSIRKAITNCTCK